MNELALFAGAGGGILGGKLLGWKTVCAVEITAYCARRLMQRQNEGNLPPFPIWDDVRTFDGRSWSGLVDVVSGGFPCTDISQAGKKAGIDGEASGLWMEMARIVREVRPRFVFVENSAMLTHRGLGRVLGDLAALGYDAEWEVVGADAIGGSQHRERIWILAYPHDPRREGAIWAGKPHSPREEWAASCGEPLRSACGYWPPGPGAVDNIPRMADGSANRAQRLRALGNTIVPQIPELIGRAILETYNDQHEGPEASAACRRSLSMRQLGAED